jgi:hypothetical protein
MVEIDVVYCHDLKWIDKAVFGSDIKINDVSILTMTPTKPPDYVQHIFDLTKDAIRVKEANLIFIPSSEIRKTEIGKARIKIGNMGICLPPNCYVVESDNGLDETLITTIHECLHLRFGEHPWRGERSCLNT